MLWRNVSPRQIIIQHKKLPEIEAMNREKIKNLCLMCEHKIYQHGQEVDMRNGGILLRGGLKQKVAKEIKIGELNKGIEKSREIEQLKSRNNISSLLSPRQVDLDNTDASRIIDSHRPLMTPRAGG